MKRLAPVLLAGFACILVCACGGSLRELPAPVDETERQHVDLDRIAAEAEEVQRFAEARRAVLGIYDAISRDDVDTVWDALSFETRALLDSVSDGDGRRALAEGRLTSDGRGYSFDMTGLLLLPELAEIVDETQGERETESARRKELDLVDVAGARRRVVLIREGDQWRLHMPRIPLQQLQVAPAGGPG